MPSVFFSGRGEKFLGLRRETQHGFWIVLMVLGTRHALSLRVMEIMAKMQ
jgi:hypothetical protein